MRREREKIRGGGLVAIVGRPAVLAHKVQARQHSQMSKRRMISGSIAPLLDFIYPPRCAACGEAIGEQGGLCLDCWDDLVIPTEPTCNSCQRPFGRSGPGEGAICGPCLAAPPRHDGIAAGTLYTDTSRKLALAFKHGGRIALAPMLARLIAARLPEADGSRLIIPVPLHRRRLWSRGYNQSVLLGRELAGMGHGRLVVDALERVKVTPSLGGLGARARAKVLNGAIRVRNAKAELLASTDIILVDDVLTSGATSAACVNELKKAGAKTVRIACFTRVLDEAIDSARAAR